MRTLRLARIAAEAEGLRLREQTRRIVVRAMLGVIAIALLIGAVAFVHIAAWYWLRSSWDRQYVGLALAGADFVLAMLLGLLAARSSPGRVEVEALAVRRQALASAGGAFAWSAMAVQLLRLFADLRSRSRSRG